MNKILNPENNKFLFKSYHLSSKLIIPLAIPSLLIYKNNNNKYENAFHFLNILNLGYHSYFSTTAIISDYIKSQNISKIIRITNLKLHLISTIGFFHYLNIRK